MMQPMDPKLTPEWLRSIQNAPAPQIQSQQFNMPAPKKKRGMFAGAQIDLNAALAGFAAGMGNPAGAHALQAIHQRRMGQQQMEAEQQQYQQRLGDEQNQWIQRETWKRANPDPVNNDTVNDYQFILQNYGKEKADLWVQNNVIDKPVVVQGPSGPVAYRPSQLGGSQRPAIGEEVDDFTQGGQTPPASGNFPSIGGYPRY